MQRHPGIAALIVCTVLSWAGSAAAQDPVSYWNLQAVTAVAPNPPVGRGATPAVIIDLAMVHAAMHDAAQAYDHRFEFYAAAIPGATGSSAVAVAKAARDVLANRFPMQVGTLDTAYAAFLGSLVPPPSAADRSNGEAIGMTAANSVITARAGDGSFPTTFTQFTGGTAPGQWQPNAGTPGMVSPWAAEVRPFVLESLSRCEAEPVPALTSAEWAEAYNEVKAFGSATGSARTAEQSAIARTFSGNFLNMYNRLFRDLAAAHLGGSSIASLGDRARLLALGNMAMADAFICAWKTKKQFNFWRPAQAIRRGDEDGNILTDPDPTWTSYFSRNFNAAQNPNYPDYTSGANNVTGAMTRMMALFFDSDKPFEFNIFATAPAVPLEVGDPDPRVYSKFSDLAKDVVDARIYLGIHYRFADTEARSQGRRVANYTFKNALQPIDKHGNK
jgi:hypothetical protein